MDAKTLRDNRAKLISDARAILDRADAEKRSLTSEELASQTAMLADAKTAGATLRNLEEVELEERGTIPESQRDERSKKDKDPASKAYGAALRSYLMNGFGMMTADEQAALRGGYREFEDRTQSTLTGAAGGFDVAPDTSFYGRIIEAQKYYGGMFSAGCTVLNTATGADLPIPVTDDTSNVGAIVAEEGSHTGATNVALAQKTLHAYLYSSKIVKVSLQLLQDSSTDWEGFLARIFGQRLGRIQNTHLTTGTGTAQPSGVVTGASSGRQSATGNTTSVPADDIIRLVHSVDVAYRGAGCKFMTNDSTALALELLKDGDGQYLWKAGLTEGAPDRLRGYPVVINNDMAALATSAKHTLFGDFSHYFIRQVRGIQVVRLNELYAENGQVGFLAFMRMDGGLVDAGQGPVRYLQNSAS
jgi:HK97 family phage major capsid protein